MMHGTFHPVSCQFTKVEGHIRERIPLADVVAKGFDELVAHKNRHVKILVQSS